MIWIMWMCKNEYYITMNTCPITQRILICRIHSKPIPVLKNSLTTNQKPSFSFNSSVSVSGCKENRMSSPLVLCSLRSNLVDVIFEEYYVRCKLSVPTLWRTFLVKNEKLLLPRVFRQLLYHLNSLEMGRLYTTLTNFYLWNSSPHPNVAHNIPSLEKHRHVERANTTCGFLTHACAVIWPGVPFDSCVLWGVTRPCQRYFTVPPTTLLPAQLNPNVTLAERSTIWFNRPDTCFHLDVITCWPFVIDMWSFGGCFYLK